MGAKRDQILKRWALGHMGQRHGNQKVARMVAPEASEITHDKLWGLVPSYTGKILRRRNQALELLQPGATGVVVVEAN